MKQSCDNCGCSVYKGYCINCDEEVFIMEQYYEQGMEIPDEETEFMKKYSKSVNNPLKQY